MENRHFLSGITVVQGGMGVGVSLGGLAGAVAAQGGAGTISAAQIGFREPDFETAPLRANLRALGKELEKARKIAGGRGQIGVNIMTVTQNYGEYVKEEVRCKADFIVSGAGLPMELPSLVKGSGIPIVPIVSSFKAASVICRRWMKRDAVLPDGIIIEGPKAGGHLGFSKEEAQLADHEAFEQECRKIIAYMRMLGEENGTYIPVITAGGFRTYRDLKRQLAIGADAVQAATPFVVTQECDAAESFKQSYVACQKEEIVIVKSPVGMPGRAIRNPFLERAEKGRIPAKKCLACISVCRPSQTPYCITQALIRAVQGDTEHGLIFCGADAWKEDRITTVREVMQRFQKNDSISAPAQA